MKMNWLPNNMTILDIYNEIKHGKLTTRPYYQRRLVWTIKDKEMFIETILNGYPFPEVYFCQGEVDMTSLTTKKFVVDGQQRLTTIVDYIDGKLPVKKIPLFNNLNNEEKQNFLNYKVIVRDLEQITEPDIKDVFNRLNRTDYTLNAIELLYAQYQGEYISTAKNIVNINENFFDNLLGEKSISRMNDLDFILQIMTTVENGIYFSGSKEVETYVALYNDYYENSNKMVHLVSKAIEIFLKLNLKKDSLFFKKAASYSLIVELCLLRERLEEINIESLKDKLYEFEKCLIDNKEKDIETNKYAQFYNYLYQATASKTARDFRGNMIRELIISHIVRKKE
ncbi:MAG: DUF262 domain-containing protein [Clostridiales bacterium]|nr:DUF262 domain-containing protein [Clostridiales bacterium]